MGLWTKRPVVLVSFFQQPVRSLCSLHKRLEVSRAHNQAPGSRETRKGSKAAAAAAKCALEKILHLALLSGAYHLPDMPVLPTQASAVRENAGPRARQLWFQPYYSPC